MTTETKLLEMLGNGAPMLEVLNELCNFIDTKSPGAISTVFLLDSGGARLRPVAGPKAPNTWREEIDNQEGRYEGFCSAAGDLGRALTVGDINSDPLFAVHREAALREGLQVACFLPILSIEKQILAALALAYPQRERWPQPDSEIIERAIHLAAIAIECYRNEQELREFSRRLNQSQDDERRRIARELHDSTGQKLAVLAMNLAMVEKQATSLGAACNKKLSESASLTREIADEIRTLSYLLHPPLLDECGFEAAIQMYLRGSIDDWAWKWNGRCRAVCSGYPKKRNSPSSGSYKPALQIFTCIREVTGPASRSSTYQKAWQLRSVITGGEYRTECWTFPRWAKAPA